MAQVNGKDVETANEPRYQTPTFDPRGVFAWTLRAGEVARLERRQRQTRLPDPIKLASGAPVSGERTATSRARIYEKPTFDPRGAFAWTLRAGEMARRERRQRLGDPGHQDILAAA